jgi:hypothetical protein
MNFELDVNYIAPSLIQNANLYIDWFKEGKIFLEDCADQYDYKYENRTRARLHIIENVGMKNEKMHIKYAKWRYEETISYNIQQTITDSINSNMKIIRIEFHKHRPQSITIASLIPQQMTMKDENNWHTVADYKVCYKG